MALQKFIIFSTLFLDIIGISIIIPAFPELKAYYGINDFQVTLGLTIYSLFGFLSAPLLGQLSDKIGRKISLTRCIAGTMASYFLLLITQQYRIFILSRIINGITGGNISILQAILTDISPDEQTKNQNYGLMGALFGLGFIFGPLTGALILRFGDIESIFMFGAFFALLECLLIIKYFKNTNKIEKDKKLSYNSFSVMRKYIRKPDMRNVLASLFLLGIGGFIINATQSLYMQNHFGTTGEQYGYYLALVGVISAFNMGYLVPHFWTKRFSHKALIFISHTALIIGYTLVGLSTSVTSFLSLFYIIVILSGAYMTVYNVEIMSKAKPNEIGELSGMLGGAQNLFMFIGPLIGGVLLNYNINIFSGAVIAFILSFGIMIRYFIKKGRKII